MASELFLIARKEKEMADADRLRRHREVLKKLQGDDAPLLLEQANQRIQLWRKNHTCCDDYISRWQAILNDLTLFETVVLNPENHHLRQNTPFRMKGL